MKDGFRRIQTAASFIALRQVQGDKKVGKEHLTLILKDITGIDNFTI
jgi:hypothetical protein